MSRPGQISASDNALLNILHEWDASSAALNLRERIHVLDMLLSWANNERVNELDLLSEIEWAGTSPLGGQD